MRSSKIEAIVIRKRDFLEKDRILTLFSNEHGKIDVLSKGSRRPGSRFSYFSDIGSIGVFYLYESKSLPIITDYKPIFSPEAAREKYDRTEKLGYMFKLVGKLYHEGQPHPQTYVLLKEAVHGISSKTRQLLFLAFLLRVIDDLGLKPQLLECIVCGKAVVSDDKIDFALTGGICHQKCAGEGARSIGQDEIKLLRFIYQKPYNEISQTKVNPKVFQSVYNVVLQYLEWHFGKLLPEKIL
jgi:DNA repair protein RecO (recombination protein O)